MKHLIVALLLSAPLWSQPLVDTSQASETKQLELTDGTVLTGQLVRVEQGVYTFRSDSLGTLHIKESEIRSLREPGPQPESAPPSIPALQQQMLSDPATMELLLALQQDPELQEIMADKSIMQAIAIGNLDALRGNPKFEKLLRHPAIRQIQQNMQLRQ